MMSKRGFSRLIFLFFFFCSIWAMTITNNRLANAIHTPSTSSPPRNWPRTTIASTIIIIMIIIIIITSSSSFILVIDLTTAMTLGHSRRSRPLQLVPRRLLLPISLPMSSSSTPARFSLLIIWSLLTFFLFAVESPMLCSRFTRPSPSSTSPGFPCSNHLHFTEIFSV